MVSLAAMMYAINTLVPLAVILSVIGTLNKIPTLNIVGQALLAIGIMMIIATVVCGYTYKPESREKTAS